MNVQIEFSVSLIDDKDGNRGETLQPQPGER